MFALAESSAIVIIFNAMKVVAGVILALLYNLLAGLVGLPLIEWWNIWILIFLLEEFALLWFLTRFD